MIVDLTEPAHRPEKIAFVMENGEDVQAILAVGMFKEGADWVQASRVIDLVPSGSDQDRNQRFGRLIRDSEGKSHISYYSFFPYQPDAPQEEQRASSPGSSPTSTRASSWTTPSARSGSRRAAMAGSGRGNEAAGLDLLGQYDFQTQRGHHRRQLRGDHPDRRRKGRAGGRASARRRPERRSSASWTSSGSTGTGSRWRSRSCS